MSTAFPLPEVLSAATGYLVSDFDGVYRVLNSLATHQLPRAMDEAAPAIIAQHPWIGDLEFPDFGGSQQAVECWLGPLIAEHGTMLDLTPMAPEDHTQIDPLDELTMRWPDMKVIPFVVDSEGG